MSNPFPDEIYARLGLILDVLNTIASAIDNINSGFGGLTSNVSDIKGYLETFGVDLANSDEIRVKVIP